MPRVVLAGLLPTVCFGLSVRQQHRRTHQQLNGMSMTMSAMAPFYHTSDDIHNELAGLAQRCPELTLETREGQSDNGETVSIDVITVKNAEASPVNKNFYLFGEHARELISPESGLHFIKSLCGETGLSDRAKEALADNEYKIVVNGNPSSRRKVEQGDFCLRVNPDGVDLNRNWDEKWSPDAVMDSADTNPGPKPFSEAETKIFKDLVSEYNPTTFLTIHSGTKGMYMPWAFDMQHLAQRNEPEMMQILKDLDQDHCQCPFGAAGREVGYSCPGTCLDYVYDQLQAQYAFAFEIYTDPSKDEELRERWEEKIHPDGPGFFLQETAHLAHEHFHDIFVSHPSDFIQLQESTHNGNGMSSGECFQNFNPGDEEEYKSVIENWSTAYLDMSQMIVDRLSGKVKTTSATASNATVAPAAVPESDNSTAISAVDPGKFSSNAALSEMDTELRKMQWDSSDSF